MKTFWNKIKHWYWWHFKATDKEKANWQMLTFGTSIMKDDKFIDIRRFVIAPKYFITGKEKDKDIFVNQLHIVKTLK